jgi:glutathione S-transferase
MKLYYNPLSTFSQKTLLAFYEKDVAFERALVQLGDAEARAAYEKIYPLGKVPLVTMEDGYMIPESTIIIEYLDTHYNQGTQLIPKDIDDARRVRFMDRMIDLYVNEPAIKVVFDKIKLREYTPFDMERAHKYLNVSYEYLNRDLENNEWVCGKDFTMADCALIPCLFNLEQFFPFGAHANIVRYWKQAQQRPTYRRVQEELIPAWKAFLGAFK